MTLERTYVYVNVYCIVSLIGTHATPAHHIRTNRQFHGLGIHVKVHAFRSTVPDSYLAVVGYSDSPQPRSPVAGTPCCGLTVRGLSTEIPRLSGASRRGRSFEVTARLTSRHIHGDTTDGAACQLPARFNFQTKECNLCGER